MNAGRNGNRFGLIYADFNSQKRTPKASAAWICAATQRNAVVQVQASCRAVRTEVPRR